MVIQNKIFSFKIKCQAKNIFPSDVERTVEFYMTVSERQYLSVWLGQVSMILLLSDFHCLGLPFSLQVEFAMSSWSTTLPIGVKRSICLKIQSNLVISNSLISNYRLSRSENLVPVFT